jgi:hypothetical protein
LWLVFVGHGSFDGRTARMNLPGPDLSAPALREILEPWTAPLVFVHGGSASAPFLSALSGENRIVVTATESGSEVNYARFGLRFAEAVGNPEADIDQDGITSVLEAFVTASLRTQQFYEEAGRLATEHAMIDDNGDARGTPYDFFNGTRLVRRSTEERISPDGGRARVVSLLPDPYAANWTAAQLEERDRLETELEAVRLRKEELDTDAYYRELEQVLRQLGELYLPDSANDDS